MISGYKLAQKKSDEKQFIDEMIKLKKIQLKELQIEYRKFKQEMNYIDAEIDELIKDKRNNSRKINVIFPEKLKPMKGKRGENIWRD